MSTTIAYSHKGGYWKTRYSFFASFMKSLGRRFFSSPSLPTEDFGPLMWEHHDNDPNNRNKFYGSTTFSAISVSFNDNVSSNKIYKSFSLEGTSNIADYGANTFSVNADNSPRKQFSMGRIKDKGGILYGHIGLSDFLLDGSNIEAIGTFKAATVFPNSLIENFGTGPLLVFQSDNVSLRRNFGSVRGASKYILMDSEGNLYSINGAPITTPLTQNFNYNSSLFGEPLHLNVFTSAQGNTSIQFASLNSPFNDGTGSFTGGDYEFDEAFNLSVPTTLLEITPQEINGAPPRGQYAQATITLGADPFELHSLSVDYEPTNLDHSK